MYKHICIILDNIRYYAGYKSDKHTLKHKRCSNKRLRSAYIPHNRNLLTAWLGFPGPGFSSTDYFSLIPWLFLFLAGYFLRRLLDRPLERLDPDALRCPPLCALGRWSLPVYMLHQPVVYGVLLAGAALLGR